MAGKVTPMLTTAHLHKYPLFEGLHEDELARLLPHLHKRTFAKGVYLFYPQSPSLNTYLVEAGMVRLFFTNTHGEEFLLNLVRPGGSFGLPVIQADQGRLMGAATYQDAVILTIACEQLLAAMQTIPRLAQNLYREASTSGRMLLIHTRALVTMNLEARLAFFLLRVAQVWQMPATIEMPLHQSELAGWLGASRGRLNRALQKLQTQGIIRIEENHILILDRTRLERLAQTSD